MTATKLKVKKGDKVVVITGRDKGKTGEILKVMPKEQRVIVQGINQVKKHRKPSPTSAGGMDTIEQSIHVSNIAYFDAKTSKPTRLGSQVLKDGTRVRVAKRSGEVLNK
jgi:large subunit ribosomal protein L24